MNPRAETLLETTIAISMIMVVMAPLTALILQSGEGTKVNKHDLLAAQLMDQALENIRNVRDTNVYRRFSPKASECWNTKPDHQDLETCEGNKIGHDDSTSPQRFFVAMNPDNTDFFFIPTASALADGNIPASGNIEGFRVRQDIATPADPECAPGATTDCRIHHGLYFIPVSGSGHENRGAETPYYQQLTITYLNLDVDPEPEPVMQATLQMQYRLGSKVKNLKRVTMLSAPPL